jgi:cyclophilin family peptidyl-prolyl cis-trans isomerase
MKTCLYLCTVLVALWAGQPAFCSTQEGGGALEEAGTLFKDIAGLRKQLEKTMMENAMLDREVQGASPERQQEIQSDKMLKNRTMERLSSIISEKQKTLFERTSALIAKDTDSIELRKMRYEAAYGLNKYDLVLEDVARLPEKDKDSDTLMIQAHSLKSLYRFDEALECFEKGLKLLEREQRYFVRFQMGICAFNAHRFKSALEIFNSLLNDAPPPEKQRFNMLVRTAAQYVKYWETEQALRKKESEGGQNPQVALETDKGSIKLELFENQAPNTVANFITLSESGFFDGLVFHDVIPQYMAQGGCPEGTGMGGPGYCIADECRRLDYRKHFVGSLSMAKSDQPNSGGSQFFITTVVTWNLKGTHTVFGRVLEGQDTVNRLEKGDRIISAKVLRKRDHDYRVKKM